MIYSLQFFRKWKSLFIIGILVYWSIGVVTVLWGLANWTVYLRPQTRITATEWIYKNIPPTALLYTEHWNDGLPLDLPQYDTRYHRELLNVYDEPDDAKKKLYYANKLSTGDYIIFSTR